MRINLHFRTRKRNFSLPTPNQSSSNSSDKNNPTSIPDAPSNMCCMSGCANCVWLDYADEMMKYYETKGEKLDLNVVLKEIEENIEDPMIKSFIKMELKFKYKNQKSL